MLNMHSENNLNFMQMLSEMSRKIKKNTILKINLNFEIAWDVIISSNF